MPESQRLVQLGTTGGSTAVLCDTTNLGHAASVRVTLTANYTTVCPPGAPARPSFTGSAAPNFPKTIASGTVLVLHKYEADALKAAGGAT